MISTFKLFAAAMAFVVTGAAQASGEAGGAFHNGEAATMTQAAALLKTVTGEQPRFALPILPPSTDATPRPQPF